MNLILPWRNFENHLNLFYFATAFLCDYLSYVNQELINSTLAANINSYFTLLDLLKRIESMSDDDSTQDNKENKEPNNEGVRHRRGSFGRNTEESSVKEYTEEQLIMVRK